MLYFYSGNTLVVNGRNTQAWGVVTIDKDDDVYRAACNLCEVKKEEYGGEFILTAFNRVD